MPGCLALVPMALMDMLVDGAACVSGSVWSGRSLYPQLISTWQLRFVVPSAGLERRCWAAVDGVLHLLQAQQITQHNTTRHEFETFMNGQRFRLILAADHEYEYEYDSPSSLYREGTLINSSRTQIGDDIF